MGFEEEKEGTESYFRTLNSSELLRSPNVLVKDLESLFCPIRVSKFSVVCNPPDKASVPVFPSEFNRDAFVILQAALCFLLIVCAFSP